MDKQSFILYYEYEEQFDMLTDIELAQIIRAIFTYEKNLKEPNFSGVLKMAWLFIKSNLDRDRVKYDKRCDTSVVNGKKGGRPSKEKEPIIEEKEPNKPDTLIGLNAQEPNKPNKGDNVNVNDNDNVNVNDSVCNTDVTKILSGIFVDKTPTHTLEEYSLVAKEFSQSRLLQKAFKTISLVDKHFDKIMAGAYRDFEKSEKQDNSAIISNNFGTDETDKLNAMFDKMNEAL